MISFKDMLSIAIREDALWDKEKDPNGTTLMERLNALKDDIIINTPDITDISLMIFTDSKGHSLFYLRELAQRWHKKALSDMLEIYETLSEREKAFRKSFKDYEVLYKRLMTDKATIEEIKELETLEPTELWKHYTVEVESCEFGK